MALQRSAVEFWEMGVFRFREENKLPIYWEHLYLLLITHSPSSWETILLPTQPCDLGEAETSGWLRSASVPYSLAKVKHEGMRWHHWICPAIKYFSSSAKLVQKIFSLTLESTLQWCQSMELCSCLVFEEYFCTTVFSSWQQKKPRFLTYTSPHTCTAAPHYQSLTHTREKPRFLIYTLPPTVNISHQSSTFITISKPTLTHHYCPKFIVCLTQLYTLHMLTYMVHSWCYMSPGFWQICNDTNLAL